MHPEVVVTYSEGPHNFYFTYKQDSENEKDFCEILKKVGESSASVPVNSVEIDRVYLVKQPKGEHDWLRVQILGRSKDAGHFRGRLIDYGNIVFVHHHNLRSIEHAFIANKAPRAQRSRLDGFKQQQNFEIENLFNFVVSNRRVLSLLSCEEVDGDVSVVDLMTTDQADNSTIIQYLSTNMAPPSSELSVDSDLQTSVHFLTDVHFASGIQVKVSHINSPIEFYLIPAHAVADVSVLGKKMSQFYTHNPIKFTSPRVGKICAIVDEDHEWHRVEIVEKIAVAGSNFLVLLVDVGSIVSATFDKLYELDRQFFELPRFAVKFGLANIAAIDGSWTQATECLKQRLLSNECPVEVQIIREHEVELFASFQGLRIDVGKSLQFLKLVQMKGSDSEVFEAVKFDTESETQRSHHPVEISRTPKCHSQEFQVHFKEFKSAIALMNELIQKYSNQNENDATDDFWSVDDKCMIKCKVNEQQNIIMRAQIMSLFGLKVRIKLLDEHAEITTLISKLKKCPPEFEQIGVTYETIRIACKHEDYPSIDGSRDDELCRLMKDLSHFAIKFKDNNSVQLSGKDSPRLVISFVGQSRDFRIVDVVDEICTHEKKVEQKSSTESGLFNDLIDDGWISADMKFRNKFRFIDEVTVEVGCYSVKLEPRTVDSWKTADRLESGILRASIADIDVNTGILTFQTSSEDTLVKVESIIKHYYKTAPEADSIKFTVGQPCVAKFAGDYYRAVVIRAEHDENCIIEFIDYGTRQTVRMSELHSKVMCWEIPILANKVKLPGAMPTNHEGEVDKKLLKDMLEVFMRHYAQLEVLDEQVPDSGDFEQFCHITLSNFTIKSYEDCRQYLKLLKQPNKD